MEIPTNKTKTEHYPGNKVDELEQSDKNNKKGRACAIYVPTLKIKDREQESRSKIVL